MPVMFLFSVRQILRALHIYHKKEYPQGFRADTLDILLPFSLFEQNLTKDYQFPKLESTDQGMRGHETLKISSLTT